MKGERVLVISEYEREITSDSSINHKNHAIMKRNTKVKNLTEWVSQSMGKFCSAQSFNVFPYSKEEKEEAIGNLLKYRSTDALSGFVALLSANGNSLSVERIVK